MKALRRGVLGPAPCTCTPGWITGDRRTGPNAITISSTCAQLSSAQALTQIDGNTGAGQGSLANALAGQAVLFDHGAGARRLVNGFRIYSETANSPKWGAWNLYGRDDVADPWTLLYAIPALGAGSTLATYTWASTVPYRYIELRAEAQAFNDGSGMYEMQFQECDCDA